ncbi:hypothetical protein Dsin_030738 [Dipteronia sinensis]|uniref:RNase H type-1 domain-containing protein n=1 Tax=Dipteronia sinensis TaxID=43782 RepID=A0AAE0DRN3_9ROSI|nr:hypothetical protein Dsin_030738 [Dipteronia sinensis]
MWCNPERGIYKVNTDAAMHNTFNCIGDGIIIRNHMGEVMGSYVQSFHAAVALLCGILFHVESGDKLRRVGSCLLWCLALSPLSWSVSCQFGCGSVADTGVIIGDILS